MTKVLRLTLTRQWFDLIASGKKIFEYREYKPHWISRLLCKSGTRSYDLVHFTNGYGKHRPYIECEYIGLSIIRGKYCDPDNGEQLDPEKKYFVIGLGRVLEIGNA